MNPIGKQLLIDYYECDVDILRMATGIEERMLAAAKAAEVTVVRYAFHQFNPVGVSGVVVIQESHLTIHTWPEHGYAAVDIFTCGDAGFPEKAADYLKKALSATKMEIQHCRRGINIPEKASL